LLVVVVAIVVVMVLVDDATPHLERQPRLPELIIPPLPQILSVRLLQGRGLAGGTEQHDSRLRHLE